MLFVSKILSVIFPCRCPYCGAVMGCGEYACHECLPSLPLITGEICKRCGRSKSYCNCRDKSFLFDRCIAPLYYEGLARRGITRFKFYGKQSSAGNFAAIAADTVMLEYKDVKIDLVTSVPLTGGELKKRGFNQSALFGRALAGKLNLPYQEILIKPKDVLPQRSLGAADRWSNISGAFISKGNVDIKGKTIMLIDDIMTTGATLSECAGTLKRAGAQHVYCVVIASVRVHD